MSTGCIQSESVVSDAADAERLAATLAAFAQRALRAEVEAFPKPGLVDPLGHSTHPDMDLATFYASIVALGPYLYELTLAGMRWPGDDLPALLAHLRPIGMRAETAMLKATGGANTHRGAIFALGLVLAASGRRAARGASLAPRAVLATVRVMTRELVARELLTASRAPRTHGERLFALAGLTGARGQAQAGYPLVLECALPFYETTRGSEQNTRLINTLLLIGSRNDDTAAAHRGGLEGLRELQRRCRACLAAGGMAKPSGLRQLTALCAWATQSRLSMGGSADLLSLTLLLSAIRRRMPAISEATTHTVRR